MPAPFHFKDIGFRLPTWILIQVRVRIYLISWNWENISEFFRFFFLPPCIIKCVVANQIVSSPKLHVELPASLGKQIFFVYWKWIYTCSITNEVQIHLATAILH